jgi:hypothetical protein
MAHSRFIQEGDLLAFEWGFFLDPGHSLGVTSDEAQQGSIHEE